MDNRSRRDVVARVIAARTPVDRAIANLGVDESAVPAAHGLSSRHHVSGSITNAIASLDLAFEHWLDGLEGRSSWCLPATMADSRIPSEG